MITLEEAKKYLRVDANDEDDVIQQELDAAESLVASVLRKDSLEDESKVYTPAAGKASGGSSASGGSTTPSTTTSSSK